MLQNRFEVLRGSRMAPHHREPGSGDKQAQPGANLRPTFLDPMDIQDSTVTILVRVDVDLSETGLTGGDVALLDRSATKERLNPDSVYGVRTTAGIIFLTKGDRLMDVEHPGIEVIGQVVLGYPGGKSLRYVPKVHLLSHQKRRRVAC